MVKGRQLERVRSDLSKTSSSSNPHEDLSSFSFSLADYTSEEPSSDTKGKSKSNQHPSTSLIQVEGVNTKEEVSRYFGKRMVYTYKAKIKKNGSHYRCIWGKVRRPRGKSGIVRAKFKSNLPPKSMGAKVRVFMYPSNI